MAVPSPTGKLCLLEPTTTAPSYTTTAVASPRAATCILPRQSVSVPAFVVTRNACSPFAATGIVMSISPSVSSR